MNLCQDGWGHDFFLLVMAWMASMDWMELKSEGAGIEAGSLGTGSEPDGPPASVGAFDKVSDKVSEDSQEASDEVSEQVGSGDSSVLGREASEPGSDGFNGMMLSSSCECACAPPERYLASYSSSSPGWGGTSSKVPFLMS